MTITLSKLDLIAHGINPFRTPYTAVELMRYEETGELELVLWNGQNEENCECAWVEEIKQCRQKQFEIPGIRAVFMVVNQRLYLRKI